MSNTAIRAFTWCCSVPIGVTFILFSKALFGPAPHLFGETRAGERVNPPVAGSGSGLHGGETQPLWSPAGRRLPRSSLRAPRYCDATRGEEHDSARSLPTAVVKDSSGVRVGGRFVLLLGHFLEPPTEAVLSQRGANTDTISEPNYREKSGAGDALGTAHWIPTVFFLNSLSLFLSFSIFHLYFRAIASPDRAAVLR